MIRVAAAFAAVMVIGLVFGARPSDLALADPVRLAHLTNLAAGQAAAADAALVHVDSVLTAATTQARRGQAAVLVGSRDPVELMNAAAASFEDASPPLTQAQAHLAALGWTVRALDPAAAVPTITLTPVDLMAVGAHWRAAGPPCAALANLRRQAEATLAALDDALATLEADDLPAALGAVDEAAASLAEVRAFDDELSTLAFWTATVEDLIEATRGIALAAMAGDAEALAAARAAYQAAADQAGRADQALTIALGEAASAATGASSAASAEALRAVGTARDALAGLSILR